MILLFHLLPIRAHGNERISLNFWSCASRLRRILRNNVVSGSRTLVWSPTSIIIVYRQHSDEHQNAIFRDHSGRDKERKVQNRDHTTVRGIRAAPAIYCDDATTMNGPRRRQMAPASRNPRPMSAGTRPTVRQWSAERPPNDPLVDSTRARVAWVAYIGMMPAQSARTTPKQIE